MGFKTDLLENPGLDVGLELNTGRDDDDDEEDELDEVPKLICLELDDAGREEEEVLPPKLIWPRAE